MDRDAAKIAKTAARLKNLYTAAVYDIMDEMGLRHQCLDLAIKPIERTMRIAGPAFTIAGAADPRSDAEYTDFPEVSTFDFFKRMYPGCVVLVAAAGDRQAGHWGELMSTAAKARGAAGVVVDGGMRDGNILFDIPDWPVFTRYMSPIESKRALPHPRHREADRGLRAASPATSASIPATGCSATWTASSSFPPPGRGRAGEGGEDGRHRG